MRFCNYLDRVRSNLKYWNGNKLKFLGPSKTKGSKQDSLYRLRLPMSEGREYYISQITEV